MVTYWPTPYTGLGPLGLSDPSVHAFADTLQGVVDTVMTSALPFPSLGASMKRAENLLLLNLRFTCVVSGDGDLPPIWETVVRGKGKTEGLETPNHTLMKGVPSCHRVFEGRVKSSPPYPPTGTCK